MPDAVHELLAPDVALDKLGARGISAQEASQTPRNHHVTVRNPRRGSQPERRRLLIGRTDGYEYRRREAEQRIAARDPDDWPTVALALEMSLPVWSQDKDFLDARVEVFTTGQLLDAMRDAGHME